MLVGGEDSYEKSLRGGRDSSRFTVHSGFDSRGSLVKSRERDETTWIFHIFRSLSAERLCKIVFIDRQIEESLIQKRRIERDRYLDTSCGRDYKQR